MNRREQKRQEQLEELARRFRNSAHTLKDVARKLNQTADHRSGAASREDMENRLRNDDATRTPHFTYLEYIEFSGAAEFRKFKGMDAITDDEIADVNWDDLSHRLLAS